jgi:hypothetical protein
MTRNASRSIRLFTDGPLARDGRVARRGRMLALTVFFSLSIGAAAQAAPGAEAGTDATSIEACLGEPSMAGRDPRECGERVLRQCLADANDASHAAAGAIACEKRRAAAWILLGRQAFRRIEAKLGDADRHLLRTSEAQFELDLRDLCAATRMLAGGDPDLAAASCASDLVAARTLTLLRLAAGSGAPSR